jgi:NitT/TauT family transport system permease protein
MPKRDSAAIRNDTVRRRARKALMFVASLLLVAGLWELYKVVGPEAGGKIFGWNILPRSNDRAMPHVWDMLSRYGRPEIRSSDRKIWSVVLAGAWFSFRLALVGFVIGSILGLGLSIVMARFRFVERGVLPYLIVSQTIPLIALAPLVVSWGGKLEIFGWEWPRWLSASVLGAFLAFFPVAVGALRGLRSAPAAAVELMESYAASWWQTLRKLRFPSAVPYIVPALKLAASSSVVGVVVAEISTGLKGGIGRLIIEYAREATGDPAKVFTAVFGAAVLGLAMSGFVTLADIYMMRNRPKEAST